jgi:hypothetical protein
MNRRNFVQLATGSAFAAFQDDAVERASAASRSVKDRTAEEIASDEDYWAEIREAFTVDRNIINFNNGHVNPAPRVVQEAMRRYLEYNDMGPWHTMIDILEPQVEAVRRRLAQAAGCLRRLRELTRVRFPKITQAVGSCASERQFTSFQMAGRIRVRAVTVTSSLILNPITSVSPQETAQS